MKVYLVGGAVRDQLLGLPVKERDWVVVGSTPAQMLALGYQQVGRDFPVFIHPETGEEYALARTERKKSPGYYGFECDSTPQVTLEEDLQRRDLTINAMAMDATGQLIDPYHGLDDLKAKRIAHVAAAFVEDPVRILRVARFLARFHHLGFELVPATRQLMYHMVRAGEVAHLVAERVWQELEKSLREKNPELFILTLRQCDALKVIFPEIDALFGVPSTRCHHPEVDSGVHTLMVLQQAVQLSSDPTVRFAALLHDLGKARTPMHAWPKHHGHDRGGLVPIEQFCNRLRVPTQYRRLALKVAQFHLQIHRVKELRAATIVKTLEQTDAFRQPDGFMALLRACEADARGRLGQEKTGYPQSAQWQALLTICQQVTAQAIIQDGFQGKAIQQQLHQRRTFCVEQHKKQWNSYET